MEMVFGPQKMKEIEAYVRVEEIVDRLRGSLGNSTTARQLVELGLGAGAGGYITGGDWKGMLAGAGAAKGARYIAQSANNKTMEPMAKLLVSDDPKALQQAIEHASKMPAFMKILENFSNGLAAPARGGAIMQGQ